MIIYFCNKNYKMFERFAKRLVDIYCIGDSRYINRENIISDIIELLECCCNQLDIHNIDKDICYDFAGHIAKILCVIKSNYIDGDRNTLNSDLVKPNDIAEDIVYFFENL